MGSVGMQAPKGMPDEVITRSRFQITQHQTGPRGTVRVRIKSELSERPSEEWTGVFLNAPMVEVPVAWRMMAGARPSINNTKLTLDVEYPERYLGDRIATVNSMFAAANGDRAIYSVDMSAKDEVDSLMAEVEGFVGQ